MGVVHLRRTAASPAIPDNWVLGTLPVGYRPPAIIHTFIDSEEGTKVKIIKINNGGEVRYINGTDAGSTTNIFYIQFAIEGQA
jgi:hypothetical protein